MTVILRCIHDDYYGYDFFLIYDKKEMKIYFLKGYFFFNLIFIRNLTIRRPGCGVKDKTDSSALLLLMDIPQMIISPADHEHRDNIRKEISIGLTLR